MGKDQELLEAARNGNIPVVEKILNQRAKRSGPLASLRRGPGANVQDSSGYSALHHAALNGHREIVHLLLSHEASTNIVDVKGSSPLHLAAWTGNVDIVRLLLNQGPSVPNIDLTTKDNETALHCAAHFGHTEVVAQLLEHRCDASIRNAREETALDLAAQYGRLETVELLVRTHPELIRPYARGECPPLLFPHTPLHLASRNGHKAVVAVLLAAGLDVNVRTSGGTALHEAALCGKVEVVRTLLDEGVDLAIRDSHHNTVMDLLGQFPAHVTHDITAIIKRHRGISGPGEGDVEENGHNPLPPIPVPDPTLGSPYENVRSSQRSSHHSRVPPGVDSSSPGTSPTHWDFYHHHAKTRGGPEDRRISGTSAMSITSDSSVYQTPPYPKSIMESSFRSEELPMYYSRDPDQMSVSSTTSSTGGRGGRGLEPSPGSTSSTGGPSPRDRRFVGPDMSPGVYMTMGPGPGYSHHSHRSHSPGSTSKVSPTPPKKPPRRNLSVSPTHPAHLMTMSADGSSLGPGDNNYEYLFLARSGVRSHSDLEELQGIGTQTLGGRRDGHMRRGRSTDQYVDMKVRQSFLDAGESFQYRKDMEEDNTLTRKHIVHQPIAITASFGNYAIRTTNPRRKLRRHNNDKNYENYEPTHRIEVSKEFMNSVAIEPIFVSNAYITLKSSQESLLDERREDRGRKLKIQPTSPTHYQQPPTPDHPPPSAMQAEKSIHERIRPLSQEYKRRSRDIETETDEHLLIFQSMEDASSGSLSSSVSLSDKSLSTDNNVEEFVGDAPFAGKFGNSVKMFALQLLNSGTVEDNLIFSSRVPPSVTNIDSNAKVITTGIVQPGSSGTGKDERGPRSTSFALRDTYQFETQNRLHRNVTLDNLSEPKQDIVFKKLDSDVELGCDFKKPVDKFNFDRSYSNVELGCNVAGKEVVIIADRYKKSDNNFNFDRSCSNVEPSKSNNEVHSEVVYSNIESNRSLTGKDDTRKAHNEVYSKILYSNIKPDISLTGKNYTLMANRSSKSHNEVYSEVLYSNVEPDLSLTGKDDTLKANRSSKSDNEVRSEDLSSNVEQDLSGTGKDDTLKANRFSKTHNEVYSEVLYSNVEPDLSVIGKDDTLKANTFSKSHNEIYSEVLYSNVEPDLSLTGKDDTLKAKRSSKSDNEVHSKDLSSNVEQDLSVTGKDDTLKANRFSKLHNEVYSVVLYGNVEPDLSLTGEDNTPKTNRFSKSHNEVHSEVVLSSGEPNLSLADKDYLSADVYVRLGTKVNFDCPNSILEPHSDSLIGIEDTFETDSHKKPSNSTYLDKSTNNTYLGSNIDDAVYSSKPGNMFYFNRSYSIVDFDSNSGDKALANTSNNTNVEAGIETFTGKDGTHGTDTKQSDQAQLVGDVVEPAGMNEGNIGIEGTTKADLNIKSGDQDQFVSDEDNASDVRLLPTKCDALDCSEASMDRRNCEAPCVGNCDGSNLTALCKNTRTLKI